MEKTKFSFSKPMFVSFILSLFFVLAFAADFPEDVTKVKNSITGRMIVSHIDFLASSHCRGRETGEPGLDVAAKYITSVFQGAGLQPAGDFGSYFQNVKLWKLSLGDGIHLNIEEKKGGVTVEKKAALDWDYLPVNLSSEQQVAAPLVFAGYGITALDQNYDDYKNLDARGKIVLVMRHEPGENDPNSPFDGRRLSNHGTLLSKILNAQKHGAVGILFATDPLNHEILTPSATGGTYWPSLVKERMKEEEDFQYMRFSPSMKLIGKHFGVRIPAVAIDGKLADDLLGEDVSLWKIQEGIDSNLKPNSFPLLNKKVSMGVFFNKERVNAFNIVAKITGSDPELKDEVVIVGAHYDHVGKDNRGQVYAGADDNASGTAGVMELAKAFQSLEERPKRTILFILFTAEEKGLLGSRYYVDNPIFPLEKTIAMINFDMISRNDVDQISVVGKYQYPKLYKVIDEINKQSVNFDMNFAVEGFIRQSDHFPFMRKDVPSVFFNSGMHDELHTPRDRVNLAIPDKTQKVTQLTFLTMWKIANSPPRTSLKE